MEIQIKNKNKDKTKVFLTIKLLHGTFLPGEKTQK